MAGRAAAELNAGARPARRTARWIVLAFLAMGAISSRPAGARLTTSDPADSVVASADTTAVRHEPFGLPVLGWTSGIERGETLLVPRSPADTLRVGRGWIEAGSFRLFSGDTLLVRGVDFLLDPVTGALRLLRPRPPGTSLAARYRYFPAPIERVYRRHRPVEVPSSGSPPPAPPSEAARLVEDLAQLDISGSKTFALEVGNEKDVALKQSLDLAVHGRIGRDVQVRAILSDRDTPLQPEGTSTELQDLDRVLVEVESERARLTLGDFQLSPPGTEFARYARQLEGVRAEGTAAGITAFATAAGSPGARISREFFGREGKQGPYALVAAPTREGGAIVAGSERVYLDGALLQRGENEDYIIDYSQGLLTFTGRHPITAYSEITVDLQVSTGQYRRRIAGTGGELVARSWRALLLTEADDRGSPVLGLSENQKEALRAAGDSLTDALRSGVVYVGPGVGDYERVTVDTLNVAVFRYLGPGGGSYEVRFDDVGEGSGDYGRTQTEGGEVYYEYRGHKLGRYMPGEASTRPQSNALAAVAGSVALGAGLKLNAEAAASDFDQNTFSTLDDSDNRGFAVLLAPQAGPYDLGPARVTLDGRFRQVDSRFRPLDRLDPAFYATEWNVESSRLEDGDRRRRAAAALEVSSWSLAGAWEDLTNWRDFRGERQRLEGGGTWRRWMLRAEADRVASRRSVAGVSGPPAEVRGKRTVERITLRRPGRALDLSGGFHRERNHTGEGSSRTGLGFDETMGRVGTGSGGDISAAFTWTRRLTFDLSGGARRLRDTGDTGTLEGEWRRGASGLISAGYSWRELRPHSGGVRQSSRLGRLRWAQQWLGQAFSQDGRWELSTSDRAERRKDVRFVGPGLGHYDSLGVYQGVGDWEVDYVELGDSARVNRMDFSLRNQMDLSRLPFVGGDDRAGDGARQGAPGTGSEGGGFWRRLWRSARATHDWNARIETQKAPSYFWPRLFPILAGRRSLALVEVQMRADLTALPAARFLSPRVRWEQRRTRRALVRNAEESSAFDLWGVRLRSRPSPRWVLDGELDRETTTSEAALLGGVSGREQWRSIRVRVNPQWIPRRGLTFGLETSAGWRRRSASSEAATVAQATPLMVWSPGSRGRFEVRATRTSAERRGGSGLRSRELERSGWTSQILSTLHLKEELDLSLWARESRPDQGRAVRDFRTELRALF